MVKLHLTTFNETIGSMMGKFYTNLDGQRIKIADKSAPAKICKPLSYIGHMTGRFGPDYREAKLVAKTGNGATVQASAQKVANHA